MAISINDIEAAVRRISSSVRRTPMERSQALSEIAGYPVYLKLENAQKTGSFKFRGATNAVACLSPEEVSRGVVGVSTGNHGRGLARAAATAGIACTICMSELVPQNKIEAIRNEGAEIKILGRSQDEAQLEADRLVERSGMTMLPPFDHADVIAGQGTLGIEIFDQLSSLKTAIIQLSGGGLISGVALALKSRNPDIRIIGVSMERGAAMHQSICAGKPVDVEELPTLADSLGGGIGLDNKYTFRMVSELVDEIVLVSEIEIAEAIRYAYWKERQIVEGSGSVAIASILSGKAKPDGDTLVLLSGGNIDMGLHHRIVSGENVDIAAEHTNA